VLIARILGPTALKQYAEKREGLPCNGRPLYNLAMSGLVICFTGFRKKDELVRFICYNITLVRYGIGLEYECLTMCSLSVEVLHVMKCDLVSLWVSICVLLDKCWKY